MTDEFHTTSPARVRSPERIERAAFTRLTDRDHSHLGFGRGSTSVVADSLKDSAIFAFITLAPCR